MKLLVVDLATHQVDEQAIPEALAGGRYLNAILINELVPPDCDPLGTKNVLTFLCGPLAGYRISTGSRLSVGGKSPLTRGIKESNSGGPAGDSIAALGYRAIIFKNVLPKNEPAVCIIDEQGCHFIDATPYWGKGIEASATALQQTFGKEYVIVSIGISGEQKMTAAGIAVTDAHDKPYRFAARGGMGAVMGSKGIKAILIRKNGKALEKINQQPGIRSAVAAFNKHVATSPRTQVLREFGTTSVLMPTQKMQGLVVRNFREGTYEEAESISAEVLRETILARGGQGAVGKNCMPVCVIRCSNTFPDARGEIIAAPVEYETVGLCGSNLAISSFDDIAKINRLCNDLGLDTIEIGAALGVLMEMAESPDYKGDIPKDVLPRFGDAQRALELIKEIEQGTELGRLIGNGLAAVGKAVGARRIPAVKGQAISAYDPRAIKSMGVTYATTPMGADHTAGLTIFAPIDHKDPSQAVAVSRNTQILRAAYDALGICVFNLSATGQRPDLILNMLQAIYQIQLPEDWLNKLGTNTIQAELKFNRAAGFTSQDDRLPDFFIREPLPPSNCTFDVADEAIDTIWQV